jgi:hypothetical protein
MSVNDQIESCSWQGFDDGLAAAGDIERINVNLFVVHFVLI